MTVPVLLVTGFLGAGKTTLINAILHADHGQRIAAIVNDFGAINIDAGLLEDAADEVIGLQNGCICCSLSGDLLRTLRLLLDRPEKPERIVIESSGAADPRGIIEVLMDPVLWNVVRLDTVVCVVDAAEPREDDPLWQAQWQFSDLVLLSKTEGIDLSALRARFALRGKPVFEADPLPLPLILDPPPDPAPRLIGRDRVTADRFVTVEWRTDAAVSLPAFQKALSHLAKGLLRAKGTLDIRERPDQPHLLQLVGKRASFLPQPNAPPGCRLVLIGERGAFSSELALDLLNALVPLHSN